MTKIRTRTCDDCRSTSESKSRTHTYDDLMELLIELPLKRENDSHMESFLKRHLGRGATPTPERGEGKGPKNPTNANKGGGKGGITCGPSMRLNLKPVHPHFSTVSLSMTREDPVMPLTATIAVVVCCN